MMARLARCGEILRTEINARWPARDRASDGWIGDAAHQRQNSDHNPDSRGIVHAIDVDRDGLDAALLVARTIVHPTTQYVIFDHGIWSRTYGFARRPYSGSNPHTGHVHVSFRYGEAWENNTLAWGIAPPPAPPAPPPAPAPSGHRPGSRLLRLASPHQTGEDVRFVQRFIGSRYTGPPDGDFGPRTDAGVRWYQRMRGIGVDGVVGPRTFSQMGVRWKT